MASERPARQKVAVERISHRRPGRRAAPSPKPDHGQSEPTPIAAHLQLCCGGVSITFAVRIRWRSKWRGPAIVRRIAPEVIAAVIAAWVIKYWL